MRYVTVFCTLLTCLLGGAIAAEMSHEETVVRTAYAKFAYAVQQGAISELAMEADGRPVSKQNAGVTSDQRLAAAEVSFTLKDFVIGDIHDVLERKVFDLITPYEGETLATSGNSMAYSEHNLDTRWYWLELRWQQAPPAPPSAIADLRLVDLYRLQWRQERPEALWQRYASYTVTVSFHGKSRGPYKAIFIFGHDSQGNEVVEPEDSTTDVTGLAAALHLTLFPDAFVLTRLRTHPVVANWLNANQVSDAACSVGQRDVCCDLVKLRCGPGRTDVEVGLSKPLTQTRTR